MKLIVLGVGGLLVLGGVWFWMPERLDSVRADDRFEDATFAVRRGDLNITVTENGYLSSKNQVELKPKYRGQNVITFLVDEGTEVKEGDLLAEFDSTDQQTKLEDAQNTLTQYETELEAAMANLEIQRRDNEAAIEKAELDLDIARLSLKRYEDGEHPNNLRKNQLGVEKAVSEFERMQERFEQVPQLVEEGFLTRIQAEEERIRLRETEINKDNAEQDEILYETYTHPMELRQKLADVRNAERGLETAREKATINIKEKEAQVSQKQRQVKSTEALIEKTQRDLENMKIIAPQQGIVLHGNPKREWERDQIKIGATVWQGLTVITLPDMSEMQVLVNVHEADIDQIEVGQQAVISLDTHKGQTFSGNVLEVATVAASSHWSDSTNKQFRVEILLDSTETELRSGITAKAEILIETIDDVLHVPIHAVFEEGDDFFCFVPDGAGGFQRSVVTVGRNNAHYVAIETGLAEEDTVLLYDPREEGLIEGSEAGAEGEEDDDASPGLTGMQAAE